MCIYATMLTRHLNSVASAITADIDAAALYVFKTENTLQARNSACISVFTVLLLKILCLHPEIAPSQHVSSG